MEHKINCVWSSDEDEICDVCGRKMYDYKAGCTIIGISLSITGKSDLIDELVDVFGKSNFNVCYVCWLRSLGIPYRLK